MKSQWNSLSKFGVSGIDDVNVHSEGDLYVTQSKYIDKTKTKQKQRPTTSGMDQFLYTFTIKLQFCIHRSSVVD